MRAVKGASNKTVLEGRHLPLLVGGGETDYTCAGCQTVLMRKVDPAKVIERVLKCPTCGTLNEV
jgi:hypothetical protein